MREFFKGQYDYIYFFYGLSFFFLAIVCFNLRNERSRKLPWAFLGLFGLAHGFNEWVEIYLINTRQAPVFQAVQLGSLCISYLLLFEFARRGWNGLYEQKRKAWFYLPLVWISLFGFKYGADGFNALVRYSMGLPAGLFSALVIYQASKLKPAKDWALWVLGILMACYALATGLVVPQTAFPPALWVNNASFFQFFGVPIQLVRGCIGLCLAAAVWFYLPALPVTTDFHPKPYLFGFKPSKWMIMLILVIFIGLGWALTNNLDYYAGIQVIKNSKANSDSPLNQLVGELTKLERAAISISRTKKVVSALETRDPKEVEEAVVIMAEHKLRFGSFDSFLLDRHGVPIAATDWTIPETVPGKSSAGRPYFRLALSGDTGYYFIMGSTYDERIYYVSYPVRGASGEIVGVTVLKKSIAVKPILRYRLFSIFITMFVCVLVIVFFVFLRKRDNLIRFIENAHLQLEAVDQMKTDFISVVSHELRTPLTSIKNAVSILLKGGMKKRALESDEKELLEIILNNTNRQTRMVNDLLDISKIEAGVMDVVREDADIVPLVHETLDSFRDQAKAKGIKMTSSFNKDAIIAHVDVEHVRRVIANLISNAIKFTGDNGEVAIRAENLEGHVLVTVRDSGIGISTREIDKLFNKFYRASDAAARQKGGSGLGLVISQGLIEALGGKMWVKSELGRGSVFYFTLPVPKKP